MKPALIRAGLLIAVTAVLLSNPGAPADAAEVDAQRHTKAARAIPTFHCLGLYWSPEGGAADKEVAVRYRQLDADDWSEGLPMRYNPIPNTDEDLADYRGSIVHLEPGTTYEIDLTLAGTQTTHQADRNHLERGFSRRRNGPRARPRHAAGDHRVGHAGRLPAL